MSDRQPTLISDDILKEIPNKVLVIGVGGAGNNTVTRLMRKGIKGVTTVAINTDAQDLYYCDAHIKLLIGRKITGGLGAGNDPELGEAAAWESEDEIMKILSQADMIFITCGLGGGTGTGAAPVIAEIAKKSGILTVSICSLPFKAEGEKRIKNALDGLKKIYDNSDTIIPIPNDKLLEIAPNLSIVDAFEMADEILIKGVKSITELILKPGLVNLDFADVRTVLERKGYALIGMGQAYGERRAELALMNALNNPLLDGDIKTAKGALINVTGSKTLKLEEVEYIVDTISSNMQSGSEVIWGAIIDPALQNKLRVTLIISGIKTVYDDIKNAFDKEI
ncbi:MAG: cell division protein FtsZ [Candidatus Asgardarchaeum sp.]